MAGRPMAAVEEQSDNLTPIQKLMKFDELMQMLQ